ncbi:HD-GYP domain-containing protein [Paenibacillus tuaregi]|uniref:HD-GYP domain-containing protein n=1 Tax=Paenibacillus tuaregi TaxID=1816681 RepID=UPI0008398650|nr:HD-GYP domain-containing protein [Paenibacillus tuaregi]
MRLISINSLQPGMKLAKKIYNDEGLILLSENAELTKGLIRRLKELGLNQVYIADRLTDDIVIPEMISEETRRRAMQEIRTNFRKVTEPALRGRVYPYLGKTFLKVVESILSDLSSREDVMIMMMNINSTDHYLYRHSLNVCVYTLLLGKVHGYSNDALSVLGLGALLHDIGKTKIPPSVLLKPDRLTDHEFDLIKQHTEIGFQMLKDEPGVPLVAAHCALQHHERLNGSGYPRGIQGSEIHEYARWLAIADSYDAMTTHRIYRSALLPHQATEILYAGCDTLYEKSKLEIFRDSVAIYPIGITVGLSTGERGVVVRINPDIPQRPVIRVFMGPEGEELKAPYEVNLAVKLSVVITYVEGTEPEIAHV